MHQLRKAIAAQEVPILDNPVVQKSADRGLQAGGLVGSTIQRNEVRSTHQRNEYRYPIDGLSASATWRDETSEPRVMNLSSNGLQIETDRPAHIAERIAVRLGDCDPVECEVRWVRDGRIGLEFGAETHILSDAGVVNYVIENIGKVMRVTGENAAAENLQSERRGRAMRHGLVWLGALSAEGRTVAAMLRNVSRQGAMLHLEDPLDLDPGDSCVLDLGKAGKVQGHVQWVAGGEMGLRFVGEFDVAQLINHDAAESDLLQAGQSDTYSSATPEPGYQLLASKPKRDDEGNIVVETPSQDVEEVESRVGLTLKELYETLYPDGRPLSVDEKLAERENEEKDEDPAVEVSSD